MRIAGLKNTNLSRSNLREVRLKIVIKNMILFYIEHHKYVQ